MKIHMFTIFSIARQRYVCFIFTVSNLNFAMVHHHLLLWQTTQHNFCSLRYRTWGQDSGGPKSSY